jgi:hypothetical protein
MAKKRDNFPKPVVDLLSKRAAYICSNPDCHSLTIAPSEADETKIIFVGEAAHIFGASGGGPRYDAKMKPEERSSLSNGIFLCGSCATMIDKNNGLDFPVDLLREWKNRHDKWVAENLNKEQPATRRQITFNVSSQGQSGGITAGIVALGAVRRQLSEEWKRRLLEILPNKEIEVKIECVAGDSESQLLANQVKDFLLAQDYQRLTLRSIMQAIPPQGFFVRGSTIIVGCNM